jgi:hypothetical protein
VWVDEQVSNDSQEVHASTQYPAPVALVAHMHGEPPLQFSKHPQVWPAHAGGSDCAAARLTKLSITGVTQTTPPTTPVPIITFRREIPELRSPSSPTSVPSTIFPPLVSRGEEAQGRCRSWPDRCRSTLRDKEAVAPTMNAPTFVRVADQLGPVKQSGPRLRGEAFSFWLWRQPNYELRRRRWKAVVGPIESAVAASHHACEGAELIGQSKRTIVRNWEPGIASRPTD